jgi:hypothetical protein
MGKSDGKYRSILRVAVEDKRMERTRRGESAA